MIQTLNAVAAGLFATLVASPQAQSGTIPKHHSAASAAPIAGGKIRFGGSSGTPTGYYAMCADHPNLCRARSGRIATSRDGSVVLTGVALDQLNAVNVGVNGAIEPAYRDAWTPEESAGDCKDYAMTKRQRLIESGWPSSALPIAIVRTSRGEEHLVLVARTSLGDFVLDNLADSMPLWSSSSYSWEKILSPADNITWRAVQASAF